MTRLQRLSQRLLALAITAFMIAPLLLLFTTLSQSTIREYRQSGVVVKARVVDKWQGSGWGAPQARIHVATARHIIQC